MHKPTVNDHPILDQLRDRWSPRAFSSRPVPPESVRSLMEAARWAASCFNAQPWRFILAGREDEAAFEAALACLNEWNRKWAAPAPLLLFAVARMNFDDGSANRHALYDTGQAMAQLTVQATALGLHVHQMAGILPERIIETYALPDGYEVVCAAAIGSYGDSASLDEGMREKELAPRQRKPLAEIAFAGGWEKPANL
jgi:nitroreductase